MPYISCIVTAFNEGGVARTALESLLAQTFQDFEVIVVDDGADELTRSVLNEYRDPRIIHLRQANDGLSSARNRALRHCRGDYICFLDSDDMRPAWSFQRLAEAARATKVDCIFSRGLLVELRNEVLPFYDSGIFDLLDSVDVQSVQDRYNYEDYWHLLMLIEPQSANKLIRRKFLEHHKLSYPNGLFFEDMIFHMGLVAHLQSFGIVQEPTFTYFRRYGRPQITSGSGLNRFDSISMAFMTLNMFSRSDRFTHVKLGIALVLSLFKMLKWCEESISHIHKYHFHIAVIQKMTTIDDRYLKMMESIDCVEIVEKLNWAKSVHEYFSGCAFAACKMNSQDDV